MGAFGEKNSIWKGGMHVSDKGYLRYSSGELRHKYVHRNVVELLLVDPIGLCFRLGQGIPEGYTVDHMDHNKLHNCPGNLLMLQKCIHDVISRSHQQYINDHWEEYQIWLTQQADNEVPF